MFPFFSEDEKDTEDYKVANTAVRELYQSTRYSKKVIFLFLFPLFLLLFPLFFMFFLMFFFKFLIFFFLFFLLFFPQTKARQKQIQKAIVGVRKKGKKVEKEGEIHTESSIILSLNDPQVFFFFFFFFLKKVDDNK